MRSVNNLTGFLFGLAIAALLVLAMLPKAHGQEKGQEDTGRLPLTDPVTLVSKEGHTMRAQHVKVGQVADGAARLCFRDPDLDHPTVVGCFVVNVKTGEVAFVNLPVDLILT
jgi:hypothetical protein